MFFDTTKKFGFIRPDHHQLGDKDDQFALDAVGFRTLETDDVVEYDLIERRRRPRRMNVVNLRLV